MDRPESLLTKPSVLNKIEAACRRRCYDPNEADECYIFVLEALQADDFKRLRSFKSRSKPETFLYTVVNRLIADFIRVRYGRKRFPEVISRLGEWARRVYQLICWKRYTLGEAYEIIRLEGLFNGTWDEFEIETETVQETPCPEKASFHSLDSQHENAPHLDPADDHYGSPLAKLLDKLDMERRINAAQIIKAEVEILPEPEQVLIRLVYGSGISVSKAARIGGLNERTTRKRLDRIFVRFREKLLAEGIRES
jgi:RNA polymerase sigma factor (sigma-70 family)